MLYMDYRYNIEKCKNDNQMCCLTITNVNIEDIKNVIIVIYNENYKEVQECYKFYCSNEGDNINIYFKIGTGTPVGEYKYYIELEKKNGRKIIVLSERGFKVND